MDKRLAISIPIVIVAAIGAGFCYWLFNNAGSMQKSAQQQTNNDSLEDYYNASKQLQAKPTATEATFIAVGDIMLSRSVAAQMYKNGKDGKFPFRKLEAELLSTDFNFGNLESPFSGTEDFDPTGGFAFNAPPTARDGLTHYNFNVLNLANNHLLDQGPEAVPYTINFLKQGGLQPIGAGNTLDEAWQGAVQEANGIKIAFIGASYASENDGGAARNNFVARIEDIGNLQTSIEKLKTQSDFIVVTMHAGEEYTRVPNQTQIDFARTAIDYGADVVIGAHPHWIQPVEQYKGKYIFYSLGNFIFDQEWSRDTKEGLMLKITLTKPNGQNELQGNKVTATLKQIELLPIIIGNYSTPRLASEAEKESIFKKIGITTNVITP